VGEFVNVVLPQHDRGACYYVGCQRTLLCRVAQRVVQITGKRAGQVDRWQYVRIHDYPRN
jgi:hypothetical protein